MRGTSTSVLSSTAYTQAFDIQMVKVLNLVAFTVTIGSQLMASSMHFLCISLPFSTAQGITKAVQGTGNFCLSAGMEESCGILRPSIAGNVIFNVFLTLDV